MTGTTDTLSLTFERELPASPEEVWEVYTQRDHIVNWFNILEPDWYVSIELDFRLGGKMVAKWGPNENELFYETQTFREIEAPKRIVTDSLGGDPSGQELATHVEIVFAPTPEGKTLMSVVQTGFPTAEVRDFFATQVWNGATLRISTYLERRAG